MSTNRTHSEPDHSLDPADWDAYRRLAHEALDEIIEYLRTVRERPVWQPMPPEVRRCIATPPPWEGVGLEAVYRDFREWVEPYALGNIHPRFWGWVPGSGTAGGIVAELLKAGLNSVPAAFDEIGRTLEQQVVAWMLEVFGLPREGSGIIVSGGSMANFVGLAVARDARVGFDVRARGLGEAPRRPVLYASTETHNSLDKSVQLLGLGLESIRRIPVNDRFEIEVEQLRRAIARDRAAGLAPFAVVGNAGTVNSAAVDDLTALASICREEGLWLHVDGAFGAIAALSPELAPRLTGLEQADSLAFDFHKWLHVQYSAGCTLFRDKSAHREAFTVPASYLTKVERGPGAQDEPSHQFGPELSREAKALKVWMSLREHGLARFGEAARRNCEQARTLAGLVEREPRLELLAPVPLNIVCFHYLPEGTGWSREAVNDCNREVLMRLQEQGIAVPSHTVLNGHFAIRVCITSHRTRREDLELTVREVLRLGRESVAVARASCP